MIAVATVSTANGSPGSWSFAHDSIVLVEATLDNTELATDMHDAAARTVGLSGLYITPTASNQHQALLAVGRRDDLAAAPLHADPAMPEEPLRLHALS